MKQITTICAIFALLVSFSANVSAQSQSFATDPDSKVFVPFYYGLQPIPEEGLGPNPTIRELRNYFTVSGFEMESYDKYNPVLSSVVSAIIPGLGQAACGKPVRGLLILAGFAVPATTAIATYQRPFINEYGNREHNIDHTAVLVGIAAVIWVWNIIDAAEVAILINKYNRHLDKCRQVEYIVRPHVGLYPNTNNILSPTAGVALAINF